MSSASTAHWIDVKPEGYGVDKKYPNLMYIPEDARADLRQQDIRWVRGDSTLSIPLLPGKVYMAPSGYKVRMEKHPSAPSWRIIGTAAEGTFCHKPSTVSGGGKSEISKSIVDYMQYGSVFVAEIDRDLDMVQEIFDRKFADRWTPEMKAKQNYKVYPSRPILSPLRSLGSVIKLLTPSEEYTAEYNAWLKSIPAHVYALVYAIKRFYNPAWGNDWRWHFSVDFVNGSPGHELKVDDRKIVGTYLRVGLFGDHGWRMFKVRQDFAAASKVQNEDDISASVVVPSRFLQNLRCWPSPAATVLRRRSPRRPAVKFVDELRVQAVSASRRRDPSRLRQAGRGGPGEKRHELRLELRTDDPRGRRRHDAQSR